MPVDEPEVTVAPLPEVTDPPEAADDDAEPEGAAAWTGQVGAPTRLLLLRHGQTELSIRHRYSGLGDPELTKWAEAHKAIVDRFGRFPHRNAILGRPSTPEEIEFLKEPGSSF